MAIADALDDAKDLSKRLWDGIHGLQVEGGLRERLSMSALVVAIHHHEALIFLLENGSYQSFMALLRPQGDAWINGAWLHQCATDQELEDFAAGKSHVAPYKIFESLEAKLEAGLIGQIKKGRWKEMCDFTHTGILQLQRNLTADTIEPNYPEDDLLRALNQANACAVIAATFAAGIAGDGKFADELVELATIMTSVAAPAEGEA